MVTKFSSLGVYIALAIPYGLIQVSIVTSLTIFLITNTIK